MTERREPNVVGLVPMAGAASRLGPLPCSKEILPMEMRVSASGAPQPRVLSHHLLERFVQAGIRRAFLLVGTGKWDIAQFLTRAPVPGLALAYVGVEETPGAPFSLDQAHPFVTDCVCALGFPDILLPPGEVYGPLLRRLHAGDADVVLGLYTARDPARSDVVGIDAAGWVTELMPKPRDPGSLTHTWSAAVWRPTFTRFMHDLLAPAWRSVAAREALLAGTGRSEMHVGDIINHARDAGLRCQAVVLSDAASLDAGTPESWNEAVRQAGAGGWTPA